MQKIFKKIYNGSQSRKLRYGSILGGLLVALMLFWPLFFGITYSKVGSHMQVLYPWAGTPFDIKSITGIESPMTDAAEGAFPAIASYTVGLQNKDKLAWNPYLFGGMPIEESGLRGFWYPPKFFLAHIGNPVAFHNIWIVFHSLATYFTAFFLFWQLSKKFTVAFFCACLWTLSLGCNFYILFYDLQVWTVILPLALAILIKYKTNSSILGAAVLGLVSGVGLSDLCFTARHWIVAVLVIASLQVYYLILSFKINTSSGVKYLSLTIFGWCLCAMLSATAWLPLVFSMADITRAGYDLAYIKTQQMPILNVINDIVFPNASKLKTTIAGSPLVFFGLGSLCLALISVFNYKNKLTWIGLISTIISLDLLCNYGFIYTVLLKLPFVNTLRPNLSVPFFSFSVIFMVASGLSYVSDAFHHKSVRVLLYAIMAISIGQLAYQNYEMLPKSPNSSRYFFPETPLLREAVALQGSYRCAPLNYMPNDGAWTRPMLLGNSFAAFQLRMTGGYEAALNRGTVSLWKTFETGNPEIVNAIDGTYRTWMFSKNLNLNLARALSVKWLICVPDVVRQDVEINNYIKSNEISLRYSGDDGCLLEIVNALPRLFFTRNIIEMPTELEVIKLMTDSEFRPEKTSYISNVGNTVNQVVDADWTKTLTIIKDKPGDIEFIYKSNSKSYVVINESYNANWRAIFLDTKLKISKCNLNSMLIEIPPGDGVVALSYSSSILKIAIAITVSGYIFIVFVFSYLFFIKNRFRKHFKIYKFCSDRSQDLYVSRHN